MKSQNTRKYKSHYSHLHDDCCFVFHVKKLKFKFPHQNSTVHGLFSAFSYKYPQMLFTTP
jgi:hypothetical protein